MLAATRAVDRGRSHPVRREFTLKQIRRLRYTGSDHFPIAVELALTPERTREVPLAEPTTRDTAEAREMVADAREAKPYVDAEGKGRVTRSPT